jgi:hypothetical protein
MKTLTILSALALLASVSSLLFGLRRPLQIPSVARSAEPHAVEPAAVEPAPPRPLPPIVDARPQIKKAIAEARPQLTSPREVERYLSDLEAQARRQHQVTALEVLPGVAAIREQYPPEEAIARVQEFGNRMTRLSAELDGRDLDEGRPNGLPRPPSVD